MSHVYEGVSGWVFLIQIQPAQPAFCSTAALWALFIGPALLLLAWGFFSMLRDASPGDDACMLLFILLPLLLAVFLGGVFFTLVTLGFLAECHLHLDIPYFD
jgi:hypothetical protein